MSDPSTTSTPSIPPTGVSNAELVRWDLGRIDAQDIDSLRLLWTADTVVDFPTGACRGADAIAGYFAQVFEALHDFRMDVVSVAESGDDVLVHWHLTGRHVGTFVGVAGTGRSIDLHGFDHFVIKDRKVVTNTVRYDQMEFARQIKMLPSDGTFADRAVKAIFNATTKVSGIVRRA